MWILLLYSNNDRYQDSITHELFLCIFYVLVFHLFYLSMCYKSYVFCFHMYELLGATGLYATCDVVPHFFRIGQVVDIL